MADALAETFDLLLKPCSSPCPYSILRLSSIREAINEFKTLTKEKALALYNYLKSNSQKYEKPFYEEVITEMEKHLAKG
ncbi:MAG: hypothetical protein QXS48_00480 [Candidatus Aenigmatarchaeota archaeon]